VPDLERRTFDAIPSSARAARQFAIELLSRHGASPGVIGDCSLVVSELVTNAIEHSDGTPVEVIFGVRDPEWWELEIVGGPSAAAKHLQAPELWTIAGAHDVSGRGLGIVRRLMDNVVTDTSADRVSVSCRRRRSEGQ
jgi:anti-sigma regulatory factor (Ser/Thr protein kinase)